MSTELTPIVLMNVRQHAKADRLYRKLHEPPTLAAIRALKVGDKVTLYDSASVTLRVKIERHNGKRFVGRVIWPAPDFYPRASGATIAFHACNIAKVHEQR